MRIKPLFYLMAFSLFFISGLLLAMGKETEVPDVPLSANIERGNEAAAHDKQLNILVIGVEEVGSTETNLEGIWLILLPPSHDTLSFIPIYPQNSKDGSLLYSQPHEAIKINTSSLKSATDIDLLEDQNTWWDEVVLLDKTGLFTLFGLVGGEAVIREALAEYADGVGEVSSWDQPGLALSNQAGLIQNLCDHSGSFFLLTNGEGIISPPNTHLMSSEYQIDIIELLYSLSSTNSEFDCQFPTLD